MNARHQPYADQSVSRYHKRHKAKFSKALESISGSLKDDFEGILLIPNESAIEGRNSEKKKRKPSAPPSLVAIVSDIAKGDVAKKVAARESVIKDALSANGLPIKDLTILHVSGLWDLCCDAITDPAKLERFRGSLILADNSFLPTFILALHQKDRVLKKFKKYVVCYCFSGSSVRGTRTTRSDLDVFCVIDDTDVKKITLTELKEKLRTVIVTMGRELANEFGIPLDLNVQVYVLTDFWEALRDSNPIIFTMVRDGVPLHDLGMFGAWKRLLQTGRIRSSAEGTRAHARTGDNAFDTAGARISSAATEDLYYTLLCYAQAILACQGSAPAAPTETLQLFRARFCKAPYDFDRQACKTLSKVIRLRKDVEHGRRKRLNPARVAELYEEVKAAKVHFSNLYKIVEREGRRHTVTRVLDHLDGQLGTAIELLSKRHPSISVNEASRFVHGLPTPRGVAHSVLASLKRRPKTEFVAKPERLEAITRQAVDVGDAVSRTVDILVSASAELIDLGAERGKWLLASDGEAVTALPLDWSRFDTLLRAESVSGARTGLEFQKADIRELLYKRAQYLRPTADKKRWRDIAGIRDALTAVAHDG